MDLPHPDEDIYFAIDPLYVVLRILTAYNLAFDPNYEDGGALPSDARLREACASTRGQCEDAYGAPPSSDCDVGFRSGCTGSVAQLEANVAALDNLSFSDDELAEIDKYATESGINLWANSSNQ